MTFVDDTEWKKVKPVYCSEVHSLKSMIRSQKGPLTRHIRNFSDLSSVVEELWSVLDKDHHFVNNEQHAVFTSVNERFISERAKMLFGRTSDNAGNLDLWNDDNVSDDDNFSDLDLWNDMCQDPPH